MFHASLSVLILPTIILCVLFERENHYSFFTNVGQSFYDPDEPRSAPPTTAVTLSSIYPLVKGFVHSDENGRSVAGKFGTLVESEGVDLVTFEENVDTELKLLALLEKEYCTPAKNGLTIGGQFVNNR